jgi:Lrp/AsnC family leucine-responsive transcriptional regulator
VKAVDSLDATDWSLLTELQRDGRLSFNELARRVHLSPPAVAERVRRLEESGVITGYAARVDPAKVGQPLLAFVLMRCAAGRCLLRTGSSEAFPEVTEVHKLSSEHCALLKLRAGSLGHLEGVLEAIGAHGELRTHIVLSTQYDGRSIEQPQPERSVTRAERWH